MQENFKNFAFFHVFFAFLCKFSVFSCKFFKLNNIKYIENFYQSRLLTIVIFSIIYFTY